MKNKNLLKLQTLFVITILAVSVSLVYAGSKNQNINIDTDNDGEPDGRGTQGTNKLNGHDGCGPPVQSGNYPVYVPSPLLDLLLETLFGMQPPIPESYHEWEGGPCCPSNIHSDTVNQYPLPNECCNGPDYVPPEIPVFGGQPTGEEAPGNHCICFGIRGYPQRLLPPPP